MTPFLRQVARHYIDNPKLKDYCFVFPNRRSGEFFSHYLQQALAGDSQHGSPRLMPAVTSISDLLTRITGTAVATDVEMAFALYEAYCDAMGDKAQEIDKFIYWAQLIINDFNDIDRAMANAKDIYKLLDDHHSLTSNYITPEVKKAVKEVFGESLFTAFFDTGVDADLWQCRNTSEESDAASVQDSEVKGKFVSFWNVLHTIYDRFHELLESRKLVSTGRQLRLAAKKPSLPSGCERLVFVGFGVLSVAEVKLFDHYKKEKVADFWWDNAGLERQLKKAPHDPGALLINGYCKRFPAPAKLEPLSSSPAIRVVGVASTVGQAKQAYSELSRMAGNNVAALGIESAIILPDENLLVPLLHSVPPQASDMNVTLGYPLRNSGIVSLMHIVARMYHQAGKQRGQWTFYREDVYDILSHPLIKTCFPLEAQRTMDRLSVHNRFRVPASELTGLEFGFLFKADIDSDKGMDQFGYVDNLLKFVTLLIDKMSPTGDVPEDEDNDNEVSLQQAFLMMYADVLNQIRFTLGQWRQTLSRESIFFLIDRMTSAAIVPFTGQPLQGLQVMGLLETRNLDFERLVILSMNERIFPAHRSINSFIPNYIRRAHGMSTVEQQEAIVAYNFYRLLNRSKQVTLIHDTSDQAMGTSEPSRYIAQLEKVYECDIEHVSMSPSVNTSSPIAIHVTNPGREEMQKAYRSFHPKAERWYLSASAINKYINCPLQFYMHYLQGLDEDQDKGDFMDAATFGSIVHDILNECYNRQGAYNKQDIENFKRYGLENAAVRSTKKNFLHIPEHKLDNDTTPLAGVALMLFDTVKSWARFVLDYDIDLIEDTGGSFAVLECEQQHDIKDLKIGDATFNFTYKPDRIDRLHNGNVRIVDYKTGNDVISFTSMNDLFDPEMGENRRKAILQLFLYCHAYLCKNNETDTVFPVIYKINNMKGSGLKQKIKVEGKNGNEINKTVDVVYQRGSELAQEFEQRMAQVINKMFKEPFTQSVNDDFPCSYCGFIDYCRRVVKAKSY